MTAPRPIRVLHTISGLSGGGLERWLVDIIRLSDPAEVEHSVFVLYPDLGGSPVYDDDLAGRGILHVRGPGLRTRLLAGLARRGRARKTTAFHDRLSLFSRALLCPIELPRAIRVFRQARPHVIHAHSGPDLLLGVLLKARFGGPLVHTVPALFSQMRMEGLAWLPGFYRRAHRRIDIFSTGEARSELIAIGVPEDKILYDLGGVDLASVPDGGREHPDWSRANILRRLGLPDDSLLALSAGRLHRSKGHDQAIEMLAHLAADLPQLHLLIIGDGPERAALAEQARRLGVADRVHLLGFVRSPQPIFRAADIYLRTTILEPENLAFYEAMGAGLPVVGYDTGWPDLITRVGHGRLVPMQDSAALAAAARAILDLPDRGRSLGRFGRDHAAAHLSVRSSVIAHLSTYKRLVAARAQAAPAVAPVGLENDAAHS